MHASTAGYGQRHALPHALLRCGVALAFALGCGGGISAQRLPGSKLPLEYGPYNASLLPGGAGLRVPIDDAQEPVLRADATWTLSLVYPFRNGRSA